MLKFVTVVHPDLPNAFDFLGEAYAISGEIDKAIAVYTMSLAKIKADPRIPPDAKATRRTYRLAGPTDGSRSGVDLKIT